MSSIDSYTELDDESTEVARGKGAVPAVPTVRFAGEADFAALQDFRARIFRDELGVQDPHYQDVFNDHFSKNVVLTRSGVFDGAVRLAYSGDLGEFFISYLTVRNERRNRADVALLLGSIFLLMRENGIRQVCGHATEMNLPMYLGVGCHSSGSWFRKYGFSCEWKPLTYQLGTNEATEERLVERVRDHLPAAEARWEFTVRIVPCADLDQFQAVFERLLSRGSTLGMIPHLGTPDRSMTSLPHIRDMEIVAPGSLGGERNKGFEYYNAQFDASRLCAVRRDSPFVPLARLYSVLNRRQALMVDRWEDATCAPGASSVVVLAHDEDVTAASSFAARACHDSAASVITAATAEEMSAKLLQKYLWGLGPTPTV